MSKHKTLGRPKGSTKEETLSKIMPAARQLFANKGYAQTTFKEIGKEIGISHAALYSYFPSKKELYLASLMQTQEVLFPHFIEAFTKGKTLKERISHVLIAIAEEHDKDASITGLLAAVPIEIRRHKDIFESLSDGNNPIMLALEGMFDEAKANGEIVLDVPSSELIAALLGGGIGVALFQYGLNKPNLKSTMEVFVSLIEAQFFAARKE